MSTITHSSSPHDQFVQSGRFSAPTQQSLWAKIGHRIVWTLCILLIILLSLPVLLLFVATAVPLYLTAGLTLIEVGLLALLWRLPRTPLLVGSVILGVALVAVLAVWLSQLFAATPPITDAQGRVVPGSIAVLEKVKLGDSEQWISIRGRDIHKPVILFMAGGPGGSQLTTARHALAGLEEHMVVVNWEQPGAGKSFNAVDRATLTPERYLADGHALTLHLRERFNQDKIYLLGESWGSALGIMLVQRYPELYHAHFGAAQMVDFLETDLICYDFAMRLAEEQGNTQQVARLRDQGPPPYYGEGVAWKQVTYLKDTYAYMNANPAVISGFNTPRDLGSPEYGLLDIVNWARGPLDTLGIVYPYLWDIDFRELAPSLEVPVYFMLGRYDVNAPPELAQEYFELLDAPHKEIIWFEHSGHSPWISESGRFIAEIVDRVETLTPSIASTAQ